MPNTNTNTNYETRNYYTDSTPTKYNVTPKIGYKQVGIPAENGVKSISIFGGGASASAYDNDMNMGVKGDVLVGHNGYSVEAGIYGAVPLNKNGLQIDYRISGEVTRSSKEQTVVGKTNTVVGKVNEPGLYPLIEEVSGATNVTHGTDDKGDYTQVTVNATQDENGGVHISIPMVMVPEEISVTREGKESTFNPHKYEGDVYVGLGYNDKKTGISVNGGVTGCYRANYTDEYTLPTEEQKNAKVMTTYNGKKYQVATAYIPGSDESTHSTFKGFGVGPTLGVTYQSKSGLEVSAKGTYDLVNSNNSNFLVTVGYNISNLFHKKDK